MTTDELREAIERTTEKIYELKRQIKETTDARDKLKLQRRLKELQYLQLWHMDLLGWGFDEGEERVLH